NLLRDLLRRRRVLALPGQRAAEVVDEHLRAGPGQRQRVLAADPAPGAGDDRDLSREIRHAQPSLDSPAVTEGPHPWGIDPMPDPHIWRTLGYRNAGWEPGRITIEWDATEEYCFLFGESYVVHGGMVSTLLDSAMGGACWTVMNENERFLTGDLR